MSHDEVQSLLGAYALNAVGAEEASAVELHLRECPQCRAEVSDHRETAALLAHSGAPAPAHVWDRIAENLEMPPPRRTPVDQRRRWPAMVSAAATVVLVAAGVSWMVGREASESRRGAGIEAAIVDAFDDPRAESVRLESPDGTRHVDIVMRPDGSGFLVGNNLPPLPDDRTYQLWGKLADTTVSLGVLGNAPKRIAFTAKAPLIALAITDEVAGGVTRSERSPVVAGSV